MFSANATQVSDNALMVEDVFSAYTYTGNGSTQTITNGIDLAGDGGMVWTKTRDAAYSHALIDTARGNTKSLNSDSTGAEQTKTDSVTAFNANGYTLGSDASWWWNQSAKSYVSWTFRQAPKFFDVVTYTGDGTANRQIAHSLNAEAGVLIVKKTGAVSNWLVDQRTFGADEYIYLDSTAAKTSFAGVFGTHTSTYFVVGSATGGANDSGATYVAYLFAHDTTDEGVIQCGSFTTDASGNATVTLGWEPQYLMFKRADSVSNWALLDSARGLTANVTSNGKILWPNLTDAEASGTLAAPTATGFTVSGLGASATWIYLAIRRPMKTPTVGTEVFATDYGNGSATIPTFDSGFPVDMAFMKAPAGGASDVAARLTGNMGLTANTTDAQTAVSNFTWDSNVGWATGFLSNRISWMFRRAPGFMDIVCYTGTGVARTVDHGLGVVPELMIAKARNSAIAYNWGVGYYGLPSTGRLNLNTTNQGYGLAGVYGTPGADTFSVESNDVNESGTNFVAYLFATLPGISKVGSYTGTGTTQQINCGFTTGARFVLIKRTDLSGDWYVWDTVRGLITGNDPYLLLNSTAAEVTTTDYIDPYTAGFEISSTAPAAINASGGTFIYLSIS